MNILICDDMQDEIEQLIELLCKSNYRVNTVFFSNGHDTLEYIHTGAVVDVCFLDIVMPKMSGVELAMCLRNDGYVGHIVFFSTSKEYGPESYRVKAFDYLIKPPTQESVNSILKDLDNVHKNSDTDGILVKISGVSRHILFRDISHVEVINHYVYFRLISGEVIEVFTKLSEIASVILNDSRFIQCNRSFIVNMYDISMITEKELTTRSGTRISISRSYPETKNSYCKWIFRGKRL